ncbi:MAG TPA: TetR/AcrR family transcriptional regulator [Solirubrobacteraceae bacterium]|jgi:AcrR family transcriptional regulator|nr:TetR/AcrR family transcriptional regulator [Solirubrobacteraceae bacterium]
MVEKPRQRGRPRSFDSAVALDSAAELFWAKGFADTSLDELSAAMGMGRPSIYNAFGDKEALFVRALERYRDTTGSSPLHAMEAEDSIRDALDAFFRQTVEYTTADRSHLGCFLGNVAPVTDIPEARRFVNDSLVETEVKIAERLSSAVNLGQLPADYSVEQGARRAINAIFSLAARARLGTSRAELLEDAADATSVVLGASSGP